MKKLFLNSSRYLLKKIVNYISVFLLLTLSIGVFGGMFSYNIEFNKQYNNLEAKSVRYDMNVNLSKLAINSAGYKHLYEKAYFPADPTPEKMLEFINAISKINDINAKTCTNEVISYIFPKDAQPSNEFKNAVVKYSCNFNSYLFSDLIKDENKNSNNYYKYVINKSTDLVTNNIDYHIIDNNSIDFDNVINKLVASKNVVKQINDNNIVVNDYFLTKINKKIGDNLRIQTKSNIRLAEYKIQDMGVKYSDIMYETFGASSGNFSGSGNNLTVGLIYMNNKDYNAFMMENPTIASNYQAYIKFNGDFDKNFAFIRDKVNENFNSTWFQTISKYNDMAGPGQVATFIFLNYVMFGAVSIAAVGVILVIMYFFIKYDINNRKQVLGILKALGYRTYELAFSSIAMIIFCVAGGAIFGYLLSFGVAAYFIHLNKPVMLLSFDLISFSWIMLVILLFIFPIIFISLTFLIAILLLNTYTPLMLINNVTNEKIKRKLKIKHIGRPLTKINFNIRLTTAFAQKSISKWFTVLLTFLLGTLVLLFEFNVMDLFNGFINNLTVPYASGVTHMINLPSEFPFITKQDDNTIVPDTTQQYYQWVTTDEMNSGDTNYPNCSFEASNKKWPFEIDKDGNVTYKSIIGENFSLANTCVNGDYLKKIVSYTKPSVEDNPFNSFLRDVTKYFGDETTPSIRAFFTSLKSYDNLPNIIFNSFIVDPKLDLPLLTTSIQSSTNSIDIDTMYGLDNSTNEFKNYFNFNDKTSNLKNIFSSSLLYDHSLGTEGPIYPVIISQKLWYNGNIPLNKELQWKIKTAPNIYSDINVIVVGYQNSDTSTQNMFMSLKNLRTLLHIPFTSYSNQTSPYFGDNAIISRRNNGFQPQEFLSFFSRNTSPVSQPPSENQNYIFDFSKPPSVHDQNNINAQNLTILNNQNTVFPIILVKNSLEKVFKNINLLLEITAIFTFFIIAFILVVLINMTVEENKLIMANLKALGYNNREIMTYVLAWYLLAFTLGLILPFFISMIMWKFLVIKIFSFTGLLFVFNFSWETVTAVILSLLFLTILESIIILWRMKRQKLIELTLSQ